MPFTDKQNLSVLENIFVEEGVQFLGIPRMNQRIHRAFRTRKQESITRKH